MYRKPYCQRIETMALEGDSVREGVPFIDLASWRDKNSRRDAAWFACALFLIVSASRPVDMNRPLL
jgi:hypothetical protein